MAHVLVIEDDHDIQDTIRDLLEDEGLRVVVAGNGRAALLALDVMPRPCVILLDLMMPVMSGWDFLNALRADPALASIPVIVTTAFPDRPVSDPSLTVLSKPYNLEKLLTTVQHFATAPDVAPRAVSN